VPLNANTQKQRHLRFETEASKTLNHNNGDEVELKRYRGIIKQNCLIKSITGQAK
jgi:hypothetical protein